MIQIEIIIIGILLIANMVLTLRRFQNLQNLQKPSEDTDGKLIELKTQIGSLSNQIFRTEDVTRNEIAQNREELNNTLHHLIKSNEEKIEKLIRNTEDKLVMLNTGARQDRIELHQSLTAFQDSFTANVKEFNELQKQKFDSLVNKQQELNNATEIRLEKLREDNSKKLEEMRVIVDEKLQATVEKRFNESFKMISERLEQVHKGLGEMQTLASGVGDLKKVLSNVKTRGTLGEIQLGNILEQILSCEQYEKNVGVKPGSAERVEFAVKLPGRDSNDRPVFLPIDSKFPMEDYQRLVDAYENVSTISIGDIETISKQFENAVKKNAKDIRDKYVNPPYTTDFAIMFVPTEGLYAEILRRPGLFELLQRDFKITVVGPSNLVAFLNSLQMGFRTLAIEKRSSEVWDVLGAIKTEFCNFGDILDKTKKKLQEATNVIDKAGVRSRAIERKLKNVQELPKDETAKILGESMDMETECETIRDDEIE
ncbi:MAG: DNA recombination protein RmuC [Candidatus Omnitrophota bacterium]